MSPKPFLHSLPLCFVMMFFFLDCISAIPRLSFSKGPYSKYLKAAESSSSTYLKDFKAFYYSQTLDHFTYRPESSTTFNQRYFINSRYWGGANTSSPIFVYLGAEQPITNDIAIAGLVNDNAPDFKALLVYIEHRYYGESFPFGSLENAFNNTNHLGYFTSAQALADYAEVLVSLKKNLSAESSPVIVLGGSYGGMLASWFRLKYPHIAMGALASSAPVLYFEDIVPQETFYVIVTNDYKEASMNCYKIIRKSWSEIDKIASKPNGLSLLSKKFKTCKPIYHSFQLRQYLVSMYVHAAQYNAPPTYPVNVICDAIDKTSTEATTDAVTRIAAGLFAYNGNKSCYGLQEDIISDEDSLGWFWQTCTDLVFPIGVNSNNTMFPVAPFFLREKTIVCERVFNATVKPRPSWVSTEFGGRDIKLVLKKFGSNIIFTNGLKDPFSGGGVLQSISQSVVAINEAEGSHCLDLFSSSKNDPKWLLKMRASIIQKWKKWLTEYYNMLQQSE